MKALKICRIIWSTLKNTRIKFGKLFIFKINLEMNRFSSNKNRIQVASSIEDLNEVVKERGHNYKKMYKNWLDRGFVCFMAKDNQSTIGIVWLCKTDQVPLEFKYKHKLKHIGEAGLIDAYVLEGKRGQGVYKNIWNQSLSEARRQGITTLYGYILNKNTGSIKAHYKLGMTDVYQIIYYIRFLWFNLYAKRTFRDLKNISQIKKFE